MNLLKNFSAGIIAAGLVGGMVTAAHAFECKVKDASMAKPGGFPDRPLTMIFYGPGGGSGCRSCMGAVTELTGVDINRDHKPGGSGTVGMTAIWQCPDGYNVLEHIDDASSAHALTQASLTRAEISFARYFTGNIFSDISAPTRPVTRLKSFVDWVKKQGGKATIANVCWKAP